MRTLLALVVCTALVSSGIVHAQARPNAAASGFKIVVVKGEDAVNIIQQKTAVAPIVEVRDKNNLPVPGVAVTFSVAGQGATFAGGLPTLTVVTNAAGQATAAGLTPTVAGALQVSATATVQGQTVVATIVQSNVMTAADVAGTTGAAGSGAGGGGTGTGSTAAGAGGSGGGISGMTIGIIGAVAGGGLVVASAAGGGNDTPTASTPTPTATTPTATTPTTTTAPTPTTPAPTPTTPSSSTFSGPMNGSYQGTSTVTVTGAPNSTCQFGVTQSGTATIKLQTASGGAITGTLDMNGNNNFVVSTCSGDVVFPLPASEPFVYSANLTGSAGAVTFSQTFNDSGSVQGATYTATSTIAFNGTVSASGVTGNLTYNSVVDVKGDGFGVRGTYTGNVPLNLK